MLNPCEILNRIDEMFSARGGEEYFGEAVTQLEHALQCAWLAEQERQPASVIVAALLHDVGHLLHGHGEDYLDKNIDDRHEELGARFLMQAFSLQVTEPIHLHVPAKRYLAASRAGYLELLSPASAKSLQLQGGPMTRDESRAFEQEPYYKIAATVRMYDDRAKVVGQKTPSYEHFRAYLASELTLGDS